MTERIRRLYSTMEEFNLDAALVTFPKHIYYLTGYLSEPLERLLCLVLPKGDEPFMLVPELDLEAAEASSQVQRIVAYADTDDPYPILKKHLGASIGQLGIEKSHLTVRRYEALIKVLGARQYFDLEKPLRGMRAKKSAEETARIKEAAHRTGQILQEGLKKTAIGMTELDVAAELEYSMKRYGVTPAFTTTVLSGANTAMPHGSTGNRKIARGDLLLFDMGVCVDGYLSDMTRTFAVGEIDRRLAEIYEIVLRANLRAIEGVRPGAVMAHVDAAARSYIADYGYGSYFTHRIGHGLGIEIHEYPSIHSRNLDPLEEGMVFTIEPGIYLPGIGGVRIEDDVLVTSTGVEVLTSFSKIMTVVG